MANPLTDISAASLIAAVEAATGYEVIRQRHDLTMEDDGCVDVDWFVRCVGEVDTAHGPTTRTIASGVGNTELAAVMGMCAQLHPWDMRKLDAAIAKLREPAQEQHSNIGEMA